MGLLFLCGCFMIGIMIVQFDPGSSGTHTRGSPAGRVFFIVVLYLFAFACFGGGATVTVSGVKKLLAS